MPELSSNPCILWCREPIVEPPKLSGVCGRKAVWAGDHGAGLNKVCRRPEPGLAALAEYIVISGPPQQPWGEGPLTPWEPCSDKDPLSPGHWKTQTC